MKERLKKAFQAAKQVDIWQDKPFLVFIILSLLAQTAVWIVLALRMQPNVYPIPLHYDIYKGIDVVDLWYKVFIMPAFSLFILLVNFVISLFLYKREKFIAHLLIISNLVVQILILAASIVMTQPI